MKCIFCNSKNISNSFLPSTKFNNKFFDYLKCDKCNLHFINPIPTEKDLIKMYPTSYQSGIDSTIVKNPYKKLIGLRYSYGYQFDLLKKTNFKGSMLDFGCGAANFLINSNHYGFSCDGVEYNPKHVKLLREKLPERNFYTVEEFFDSSEKYDLIRLSNVLEHFTEPHKMMNQLKKKLTSDGYFLIEGPIEMNFNLAKEFRRHYFNLRKRINKNYIAEHTPTHIFFTDRKNQLNFFKNIDLHTLHYKVNEAEWPFPNSITTADGAIGKLNFLIAKLSMLFSSFSKKFGNTFIYLGKV